MNDLGMVVDTGCLGGWIQGLGFRVLDRLPMGLGFRTGLGFRVLAGFRKAM